MDSSGEHAALLSLEAAAFQDVDQLAKAPLADKARTQKLSAAIQDKFARIRALTRDLDLEVEELDSEDDERVEAATQLAQHKSEYARLQAALRDAALAQRSAALRSAADDRRELLAGGDAGLRQRKLQAEGDTVAMAEDVTGGLRRTRQVLAEELEHTSATLAAMEASHTSLGRTRDEYQGQHRKLRQSRGLLGTLSWQAKSETYMLWMGLTLFLAVCAYVFQKRAAHFVPDSLKPSALLGALTGRGQGTKVGRQPLQAPPPSARLRADAPPHIARQQGKGQGQQGSGGVLPEVPHGRAPPPLPQQEQQQERQEQQTQHLPPYDDALLREMEAEDLGGWAAAAPYAAGLAEQQQPPAEQQALERQPVQQVEQHQPPPQEPAGQPAVAEVQPGEAYEAYHSEHEAQHAEHEPAEWPTGSPAPQAQHLEQQLAEAGGAAEQWGEQHQQEAAAEEEQPGGAEEQWGEQHQQEAGWGQEVTDGLPYLEDPPLPAVDMDLAAQADAAIAALAQAAAKAESATSKARAADEAQAAAEAEAAAFKAQAAADAAAAVEAEAEASAVGPEGAPEVPHDGGGAAGSDEAGAEQAQHSSDILDRHGRRIAVDGPDFVRTHPSKPPPAEHEWQQGEVPAPPAETQEEQGEEAAGDQPEVVGAGQQEEQWAEAQQQQEDEGARDEL